MRRMMIPLLLVLGLIAAACAPAAAPGGETGSMAGEGEGESMGATMRMGIDAADIGTLDPHFAATTNDRAVVDMIFNALVRYKPGGAPEIEADLAEAIPEPEITDDGKQLWTFNLRQGVMCHAGPDSESYELTSADVLYSLNKSADGERSAYASAYDGWTFEAPDDYTVQITIEQPLSPVLFLPNVADYAGGFIVCSQAVEAMGDEAFKTHPVGTGPFVFDAYTPLDSVALSANADYFRGEPELDGVLVRFMPELNSREFGLKSGELDVISGISESQWIQGIQAEDGLDVDIFGPGEVGTIHFNQSVEPLNDERVRKAIALALDREEFIALFAPEATGIAYSPVPSDFMIGGITAEEATEAGLDYSYDIDAAMALMEEMHSQIREDVNPIVVYGAFRPNADVYLTRFYLSDSIVVTGAKPDTNFSHYTGIDDMILEARFETDADTQTAMWKEAQTKILEEMVAHTVLYTQSVYARSSNVDFSIHNLPRKRRLIDDNVNG